mgnify:CR=1 FL=1
MTKLQIRAIAAQIMVELCNKCDSNFQFKGINAFEIFKQDKVNNQDIVKASKYLCEKKYISSRSLASENWEGSIAALGIDWVEDYLNINHSL